MKYKIGKFLFLFFLSCEGNEHFRARSDYHFWHGKNPELKIQFKKVSDDNFCIKKAKMVDDNSKISISQEMDKTSINLSLEDNEENNKEAKLEKKIQINEEYYINLSFLRQYQMINFYNGVGKIFHLIALTTDIPNVDIKTNYKNKILYNTYVGENVIEIEY